MKSKRSRHRRKAVMPLPAAPVFDVGRFNTLSGPIQPAPTGQYKVKYQRLARTRGAAGRTLAFALLTILLELVFIIWLFWPGHIRELAGPAWLIAANVAVIATIAILEGTRLLNVISLAVASVVARDPIPVEPEPGRRVAFVTTIVPSKEPVETVRATLIAARALRYQGNIDVWLLDEGNDPAIKAMCKSLGVKHFSRKGISHYNQPSGPHKAKSKHGNYNAWLDRHGESYDFFMSVDPDHVPLPSYAERMLGYFRDPDVAFVVGPQNYANATSGFVTMAAESQQFPFHAIIQRAANRYACPMLVGTNNAFRISALMAVGGLRDSVTEDMATGIYIHSSKNPATGKRWKSVYTPDVLAVGEGPSSWGDYFSQQDRWSRGTFEVLAHDFWRRAPRLGLARLWHYGLITTFYPSMALGWLLGTLNVLLFVTLGASGIDVPVEIWAMLFVDATAFQLWLYVSNRRYNVSPFETEGSFGLSGMMMSVVMAPIFAGALIKTIFRQPATFVVTPKGSSSTADTWFTFRIHLLWACFFVEALALAYATRHGGLAAVLWPGIALLSALGPIMLWRFLPRPGGTANSAAPKQDPGQPLSQPTLIAPRNDTQTMETAV